MSNDRINLPGGVDKVGHSSIQAWSAGALFPAVLARIEIGPGPVSAWDLVHYEVIAYGEKWIVFPVYVIGHGFRADAYQLAAPGEAPSGMESIFGLGYHKDLYDAAAQFALGLVMAHEMEKAAQAAYEAGFEQMELDLIEMGAIPAPAPAPRGWSEVEAGREVDDSNSLARPMSPEEEEIPADYWMEKKALLASDYPAEEPPAAVSWLERRPARDCGVRS